MKKIISFFFIILLGVWSSYYFYHNKPIHFSIDDVNACMINLNNNSDKYNSVFDEPFFATLKKMHERTGAKFTLYLYEKKGDFTLKKLPSMYHKELKECNSWLRFGFHAPFPKSTADSTLFMTSYIHTKNIITEKLGNLHTQILRLDYFFATPEEIKALRERDVTTLLSADDNRISYSLSRKDNEHLIETEILEKNGMTYKRTDARIEKTSLLPTLIYNATDDELFLFTHEWCFFENTKEINVYLFFFYLTGSTFTY